MQHTGSRDAPRPKALVVEDDSAISSFIRICVEQLGYEADAAYDGGAALHALREERPAVVFMDLGLPVVRGEELVAFMKSRPDLAQVPVIIISACDLAPDADRGLFYLRKPCTVKQIQQAVSAAQEWSKVSQARRSLRPAPVDVGREFLAQWLHEG